LNAPADLVRKHAEQAHIRRAMDQLDIADGPPAGLDAFQKVGPQPPDILLIRLIQLRLFVNLLLASACRKERPAFLPAHVECAFGAVEIAADTLGLLGGVARELAMLPESGKILELIRCEQMVGRIGGLSFFSEYRRAFYGPSAGGVNGLGPFLFHYPENLVHPVHAPVAKRTVTIIEELPEALRVDFPVVWTQRPGPAPHVPVQTCGRFFVWRRFFWPAPIEDERTDHSDFSRPTFSEEFHAGDIVG